MTSDSGNGGQNASSSFPPESVPKEFSMYLKVWVPLLVLLLFSGVTLLLWQEQVRHQHEILIHHLETTAEQIQIRIEGLMQTRIASLSLVAERWIERNPPDYSQKRFLDFSETLVKHYPGFAAIAWIDPESVVQWIYPERSEMIPAGTKLDGYPDARVRSAFERCRTGYSLTPDLDLAPGKKAFELFLPLAAGGAIQGYLGGVFVTGEIMALSVPPDLPDHFAIRLYEEGQPIYSTGEWPGEETIEAQREIRFGTKVWQVRLSPRADALSLNESHAFLIFGLLLSSVLALLTRLLLQRMDLYRESRDQALHEISERQKVEKALRENETKLTGVLEELNARNDELESFVYTVSHDLKTPIVTIEGFIGALKEDFGHCLLTEDGERYLKYMSDAAHKMESLIDDLLNLSRIGRMVEKKTSFPIGEVIHNALEGFKLQIDSLAIRIEVQQDLPKVYGEKRRIAQVYDNLLSNAIKYIGKDNASARIKIGVKKQENLNVFFVQDNGIGIEEKYLEKVFQIFQRLPAAKQLGEGTGMGLTIVKKIVEHHGGRVWIESVPGTGSTFYFTLGGDEPK